MLCEDTRRTRELLDRHGIEARLLSATTSTTRRSGRRELLPRLEAGERIALVSDAGLPGDQRPGRAADRGGARGGRRRHRAARAVRGRDGARRQRARRRALPVRRLPAARRAGARGARQRARPAGRGRWSPSSRRSGFRARSRSLARALPGRAGGRLPRADEALRGGRRAARSSELAERFARAAEGRDHARPRARPRPAQPDDAAAIAAVGGARRRRACRAARPRTSSRGSPARRATALPRRSL